MGCPSSIYNEKHGLLGLFIGYKGLNKAVTKQTNKKTIGLDQYVYYLVEPWEHLVGSNIQIVSYRQIYFQSSTLHFSIQLPALISMSNCQCLLLQPSIT